MKNKKLLSILFTLFLLIFSFYCTAKSKDIVKSIDPIMKKIEENKSKYEEDAIDAVVKDNTIIPGIKGKIVDKNISYSKMKSYGAYNESLISIKEVSPKVSIYKNYDKYLISGNEKLKQVSLVFIINDEDDYKTITNYLNLEHLSGTLLINSNLINENLKETSYETELLFNKITDVEISSTSNYLDSITNKKNKYCITKTQNNKLLDICKRHKMHTVIPNITLNNNSIMTVKKELKNGSILLIEPTMEIKKELDYIVYYIKSKGYNIVNLDKLLSE